MRLYKGTLNYMCRPTGKTIFTNAIDKADAERIMKNNIDTRTHTVTDVKEADILEMDLKSIPIGFIHPMAK